ncbi:MAG: SIMPL domain-containing protein [Candidatus Chisholmbacteria bacterium]|nr:SIMPL domain-containing protein [Candidatus Chisholmbacteria bacterium]
MQKQSTFDATGEGKAAVVPDVALTSLGITITQPNVASAQEAANRVINSITAALKESGVGEKDLRTQNYSINPQYDFTVGQRVTGYTVNATLEVKFTDFAKLEGAIDSAVSLGANQVGGITFTLSDEARLAAETEAIKEAVDQAKAKAESLASAAGIKLGRIINVYESGTEPPLPYYRSLEAMGSDVAIAEPTELEPGSTEVRLSVTLSYETL